MIKKKSIASLFLLKGKREEGNAIDMMGAVFVVVMMFAVILALISYGTLVEKKLAIDNTVKEYLYIAEQFGLIEGIPISATDLTYTQNGGTLSTAGLATDSKAEQMIKDLDRIGCTKVVIHKDTTREQQEYGEEVVVDLTVSFDNPFYKTLGTNTQAEANANWFRIFVPADSRIISYHIRFESSSRW